MGAPPYGLAIALVLGLLVFAVGVAPGLARDQINENMASWIGRTEAELYGIWGAPTAVMSDGQGGKILIYGWETTYQSPGTSRTQVYVDPYGRTVTGTTWTKPPSAYTTEAHRTFYVSASGRVYAYSWRGLDAPAYSAP